jgi:hypothetical protein
MDNRLQAEYELMQLPIRKIAELDPPKGKKGSKMLLVSLIQAAVLRRGGGNERRVEARTALLYRRNVNQPSTLHCNVSLIGGIASGTKARILICSGVFRS